MDFAAGEKRAWLRSLGHRLFPIVGWAERGGYDAIALNAVVTRSDVLRLWNGGSLNSHYVAEAGGARGVVHLINYAGNRASHDVSLWLARPWKRAVLTTFDGQAPLKTSASNGGIEIPLPPLGVYAAIELEA